MLDTITKRRIDTARDILVGKLPDPKSQVEQITIALIYKFMDDMDKQSEELGGEATFFTDEYEKYAWSKIFDSRVSGYERINLYGEAIQKMNQNPHIPQLFRNIFKNAYLPYRDPETLKMFLKVIGDFEYDHSEKLGDAFEYLLSIMGSQGDAGQFRTPRHIIDFMVKVVDPCKNETVLDPACGTAGFLISSYNHILNKNKKDNRSTLTSDEKTRLISNFTGYDISPDMVRLSLVNMYLHKFSAPKIYEYDTLSSEEKWDEVSDVILANPPFMSPKGGIKPHKRFSIQANRSEVLFVDYIAEHLNPNGKGGVIVPEGIIFQSGNAYKKLRKMLIEISLYAVVSLPAGVFNPYSGVKTSILFLNKNFAKKTDKILFVKVNHDGFGLGAQRKEVKENDLPMALEIINKYKLSINEGKEIEFNLNEKKIAHLVKKEKIAESGDYNLSGDRYKEAVVYNGQWDFVELNKICKIQKGNSITKKDAIPGDIPVIAGGQNPAYYHNKYNRNGNIITISASGAYAGFVNYFEEPIFASDCSTVKSLDEKISLTKYIYCLLKGKQNRIYSFQRGGAQPHVYPKDLVNFIIPLPPLKIQEQIVAELDNYQKIIDGAKQVVENYKPTFKIDPGWEKITLKEVCNKITDGTHKTPKYMDIGIPFLRVTDVTGTNQSKKYITYSEHKELIKRCKPEKGDILYTKNGTIGVAKIINWEWEFSIFVSLALLKPKNNILYSKYLEIFLNSEDALKQAISHSKSGTVTNLHLVEIKQMKIPLPTLKIQQKIITKIEREQKIINSNKELITIFENKIKDKIADVWGEQ